MESYTGLVVVQHYVADDLDYVVVETNDTRTAEILAEQYFDTISTDHAWAGTEFGFEPPASLGLTKHPTIIGLWY